MALFFDEVVELFGKRTELTNPNDRYANLTVDYLRQKLEGFDGFDVLATDSAGNMDDAFIRRHLEFDALSLSSVESNLPHEPNSKTGPYATARVTMPDTRR